MTTVTQFQALKPGARLSERVAAALEAEIRTGRLAPGDKLPSEAELVQQFSVSRIVVREALSRLKSLALVDARQGSGVFVREAGIAPLSFDANYAVSKEAVIQMVELRRALEAEVSALAAERRTEGELRRIRQAIDKLEKAVAAGGDGVLEDVAFHRAIADAARNPFLLSTLQYLSQFVLGAMRVTRANEARRHDFAREVRNEHAAILDAIEAGDAARARRAAYKHMDNAIRRIHKADQGFWQQEGEVLASALMRGLPGTRT